MQKRNFIYCTLLIASAFVMITACKKEEKFLAPTNNTAGKAFIRILHASYTMRKQFNQADTLHVFANGVKLNSSALSYGSAFPTVTGNAYAAIDAGTTEFKLSVAGVVNPDSIEITKLSKTLVAGKYYSLILTDSFKTASKDSSRMFIEDKFSVPAEHLVNIRFIHAVMNDTAGKKIDLYSTRRNSNILTNYVPSQVGSFFSVPYNQQVNDTLIVRRAGTTIELAKLNGVGFGNQRVYTLVYRGNGDSASTAKAQARTLVYYVNK